MPERFLTFDCVGETLAGILHEPERQPRDIGVLIIVGGPQYRVGSHRQFVLLARDLCVQGFPVLRFDYRGMGDSSGAMRTFEDVNPDIAAALAALRDEQPAIRRVVCIGLCDAASAVLMFCEETDAVDALVLINPWARTESSEAATIVRHYYARRLLQKSFWTKLFSAQMNPLRAIADLFGSIRKASKSTRGDRGAQAGHFLDRMARGFGRFRGPVLFVMSDRDLTAREFEKLCTDSPEWAAMMRRQAVKYVPVLDADHTFSSTASMVRAHRSIAEWLGHV